MTTPSLVATFSSTYLAIGGKDRKLRWSAQEQHRTPEGITLSVPLNLYSWSRRSLRGGQPHLTPPYRWQKRYTIRRQSPCCILCVVFAVLTPSGPSHPNLNLSKLARVRRIICRLTMCSVSFNVDRSRINTPSPKRRKWRYSSTLKLLKPVL